MNRNMAWVAAVIVVLIGALLLALGIHAFRMTDGLADQGGSPAGPFAAFVTGAIALIAAFVFLLWRRQNRSINTAGGEQGMSGQEGRPVRWLEDFAVGDTLELGGFSLSEEEIIAFARKFDPQPFHIDPMAAQHSPYGGIIASGWHTASAVMRILVDELLSPESSLGSPGLDELRWMKPVRPGDQLRVRVTVLEVTPSRSRPDRGSVRQRTETLNQRDELVMLQTAVVMMARRPA